MMKDKHASNITAAAVAAEMTPTSTAPNKIPSSSEPSIAPQSSPLQVESGPPKSPPSSPSTSPTPKTITNTNQRNKPLFYQHLFLTSLSLIYLQAFTSYYTQYPGLNSTFGIEPVKHVGEVLRNTMYFPPWVVEGVVMADVDSFCELIALGGGLLSTVAACGLIQHGILFLLLTVLYYFLTTISGTFYSFQWDILLLETSFITALCYTPFQSLRLPSSQQQQQQPQNLISLPSTTLGTYPLRLLLFKLMFMSGVVKIQSSCPTWSNLTALEYHFATQCIPSPLSWHVHQIHPFLLRFGVAITFIIEIPAAFLLIAPWRVWRVVGGVLQIVLQVLIVGTGNYNFFNWLTILLCLPCFVDDYFGCRGCGGGAEKKEEGMDVNDQIDVKKKQQMQSWSKFQSFAKQTTCILFLLWSSDSMLQFQYADNNKSSTSRNLWHTLNVKLTTTKSKCDDMINKTVPYVVPMAMFLLVISAIYRLCLHLWAERTQGQQGKNRKEQFIPNIKMVVSILSFLLRLAVCLLCMGIHSVPLITLTPELQSIKFVGYDFFLQSWGVARSYRISNGYGLFRRMTGVGRYKGTHIGNSDSDLSVGWAGLPPSVVARPEIILEAVFEDESGSGSTGNTTVVGAEEWREIKFRWKPGDVEERPRQVAPHQPRLDWQMWFAALGQYQHNPWLIHLMDKILDECKPVLSLLDEADWFSEGGATEQQKRISGIRAKLFHYDFTRINTEWNRRIPGVDILESKTDNEKQNVWRNQFFAWPDRYWSRSFQHEYVPTLKKGNPSVAQFLSAHGYEKVECIDQWSHRCYKFEEASSVRMICEVSSWIRANYVLCNILPFLLMILIAHVYGKSAIRVKNGSQRGNGMSGIKLKKD